MRIIEQRIFILSVIQMKRIYFYLFVCVLVTIILGCAAYNARTVREYASDAAAKADAADAANAAKDPNASPPKTPGLQYQQALELNAILQDTTLSSPAEKINLIKQLNIPAESPYGKALMSSKPSGNASSSSSSTSNANFQILQLQELLNKNMYNGQLAARIIAEDQKMEDAKKVQMIQKFGSPPPVYPGIFNGTNTVENEIALVQTKGF